jgi:hypothetical protein
MEVIRCAYGGYTMKKFICCAIFACVLVPLLAQNSGGNGLETGQVIRSPAELYPLRLDVTKVYIHADGYRIVYRKGSISFGDAFLPASWFVPGGKAQLVPQRGPVIPYAVVYYKENKEFSHIKLYVHSILTHESWGRMTGDVGDRFKADTLVLDF